MHALSGGRHRGDRVNAHFAYDTRRSRISGAVTGDGLNRGRTSLQRESEASPSAGNFSRSRRSRGVIGTKRRVLRAQ